MLFVYVMCSCSLLATFVHNIVSENCAFDILQARVELVRVYSHDRSRKTTIVYRNAYSFQSAGL
jgi:hypothetical protein